MINNNNKNNIKFTAPDALERILKAYGDYYDVERIKPAPPFVAEAVFHSHEEQYFLTRAATIAESESHEYIFFALEKDFNLVKLRDLSKTAWETGLARIQPNGNHRNSDIALIILTDQAAPDVTKQAVRKIRYYKSYRWGFQGWSHFRLVIYNAASGDLICNPHGREIRELVRKNLKIL